MANLLSPIGNQLGKNKTAESRIEIKLNISFKIIWTVINNSVRQNSKVTGGNFGDKIKRLAHLFKWLIQIIVSLMSLNS